MDTPSPVNALHDNVIRKLEGTFSESLHIQDTKKSEHAYEGFEQQEIKLDIKSFRKCSTFPYPDMMLPSSSSEEENDKSLSKQSPHQSYSSPGSLSAHPKLVSAMKGSREKEGRLQMKLTVKWAPDVHDPVPTLLSHTVKMKKQQKSRTRKGEKKNGKKSQKVNYSKRGSSKDKQYQNRWVHSSDEMFEACTEIYNLEVANNLEVDLLEKRCNMLDCITVSRLRKFDNFLSR